MDLTQNPHLTKAKLEKCDSDKLKSFCIVKETAE
jgi:hypothetical protein